MSDWILAAEGTAAGHRAALVLAVAAAFLHALFGALQKGRTDPWTSRALIDGALAAISLPVALLVVPWPEGRVWLLLLGSVAIHFVYKVLQAMTYDRGAFTVVYPVVRGTAPLFAVLGAGALFGERFGAVQWAGLGLLLAGLYGLSAHNVRRLEVGRATLLPALGFAVATGLGVALYTTWDAYGIRAAADPFTFLAWFFVLSSLDFPAIALARGWFRGGVLDRRAAGLGLVGAVVAWGSFGSIMLATRLDDVGEAAVLRETSVVFAALIGRVMLGERVGPRRLALMGLIALGAVIVEAGG